MMNDYILEDLMVNDLKIYQHKNQYSFTSDATILAEFVSVKKNQKIVEACSGSGVISILLTTKGANDITCFEIQNQMVQMSIASIEYNNLSNTIKVVCDDFQNAKNYVKEIDIIVCNPPYFKSGKKSKNAQIEISKFETSMTLESLIKTSASLLKDKGSFYICFTPDRTSELISTLSKHKLEPKIMFFTQKDITKQPSCVFVKAVKNGNSGTQILPTLFTHDKSGKFVLNTKVLFEKYKNFI